MSHGARSLAVPTYHIRPMGGTATFHDGKQRATRPSVSRVSSSDGTAGWPSLSTRARPVKIHHTNIYPIGCASRCKKATIVAELTHLHRRRRHGNRLFPIRSASVLPAPAGPLSCDCVRAATSPMAGGLKRPFEPLREAVRPAHRDSRQKARERGRLRQRGRGAIRLSVGRIPGRRPEPQPVDRAPGASLLPAPSIHQGLARTRQARSRRARVPARARRTCPDPVSEYDVVAIAHTFARTALTSRLERDHRGVARDELLAATGAKARWAPAPVGGRQAPVVATTRAGWSAVPKLLPSIGASTGREHVRPA